MATKKTKPNRPIRARNFMASVTTDYAISIDELEKRTKTIEQAQYAIILHDNDSGSDHYHIAISVPNPINLTTVANALKLAPNFIEKWDNRTSNLWAYLLHNTNTAGLKFNYNTYIEQPSKFRTNLPDFAQIARKQTKATGRRLTPLIAGILSGEISKRDLLKPEMLEQYYIEQTNIDRAFRLRAQSLKYNAPNCSTILITGSSGVGKTTKATAIASDLYGDNFTIASSSNDPLQDYYDEKCLIIDDFRPDDYPFVELLQLLDPYHRKRTHRARYYNRPLATELIILTSTCTLEDIEHAYSFKREDMKQLRRRLQTLYKYDEKAKDFKILIYNDAYDIYEPPADKNTLL